MMNADFREALKQMISEMPGIIDELQLFDSKTGEYAVDDMLSVSLARSCLCLHADIVNLKAACSNGDADAIKKASSEIIRKLCEEQGIRHYPAIWAVNCWLYSFGAQYFFEDQEYYAQVQRMTDDELSQLSDKGDAYATIVLFEKYPDRAELIDRMIQNDHPAGNLYKAEQALSGTPDEQTNNNALDTLVSLYNMGYNKACALLVKLFNGDTGLPQDTEKALFYAQAGAEADDVTCLAIMGDVYNQGIVTEKDEQKAFAYYMRAAEKGHAKAQSFVAIAYDQGLLGCEQDANKALYWMKKSADNGDSDMAFRVGYAMIKGDGVQKNVQEALHYLIPTAEKGNEDAMIALAHLYTVGDGVPRDYEKAVEWLKKAADHGNGFACHMLAKHYREGTGVPRNMARADQYDRKAQELGYNDRNSSDLEQNDDSDDEETTSKPNIDAMENEEFGKLLYNLTNNTIVHLYEIMGQASFPQRTDVLQGYLFLLAWISRMYKSAIDNLELAIINLVSYTDWEFLINDMDVDSYVEAFLTTANRLDNFSKQPLGDVIENELIQINSRCWGNQQMRNSGLIEAEKKEILQYFVKNLTPLVMKFMLGE